VEKLAKEQAIKEEKEAIDKAEKEAQEQAEKDKKESIDDDDDIFGSVKVEKTETQQPTTTIPVTASSAEDDDLFGDKPTANPVTNIEENVTKKSQNDDLFDNVDDLLETNNDSDKQKQEK